MINIASGCCHSVVAFEFLHTASKSAMGVTRDGERNEWARDNINVNAIAPGYMETNNTKLLREDAVRNGQAIP
ncbi:SDR family NAD(P)-dependent oxidoreductase [Vibrio chagasii]|nr:SDR family NAD(P)-dependent oxidoreductase [Vibrio chagasii]